jgi:hypothetical protein
VAFHEMNSWLNLHSSTQRSARLAIDIFTRPFHVFRFSVPCMKQQRGIGFAAENSAKNAPCRILLVLSSRPARRKTAIWPDGFSQRKKHATTTTDSNGCNRRKARQNEMRLSFKQCQPKGDLVGFPYPTFF